MYFILSSAIQISNNQPKPLFLASPPFAPSTAEAPLPHITPIPSFAELASPPQCLPNEQ